MHIITRWILVCVAVCTAIPTIAGDVGFLDAERAVSSVKEGQRQLQALEAWGSPVIKELENDLLKARRDFEDVGRAFNRDMESKQNEFLSQVATQIGAIASEYAAANGFDAVFVLNAQPLVYVADSVNITDAVIKLYDERYPIN
jgi:Skp family chaperone for outer membrane proteins